MNYDLTIGIVAYHNYNDIRIAVKSIEEYTDSRIKKRIYIIDNSNLREEENESAQEFQHYLRQYHDVEYISTGKNLGFGKGHNFVIPMLDSQYHAIVNPDIEIKEDVFSSILSYMDREKNVGMLIPRIIDREGKTQAVYREYPTVLDMFIRMFCKKHFKRRQASHTLQHMDYDKPFQVPFAQGCFLVIRTEMFCALKGFDERYFMYMEDADLCRCVNEKSCVMYYPDVAVIHTWEKGSHKNTKLMKIHVQSMLSYFNKWGWKLF